MVTIKGFDSLTRKLKELEKAISALDGEITKVGFDPCNPQSIDLAIQKMEAAIDERVGGSGRNDIIDKLVEETKDRFRRQILERAAAARSAGQNEHEA